jgi:hypothetical protein
VPDLVRRTHRRARRRVLHRGQPPQADQGPERAQVAGYSATADSTKDKVLEIVAREVREFLAHVNLSEEIARLLTTLSFEVKTEIRFIPNDASQATSSRAGGGEGEDEGEKAGEGGEAPKSATGLPKPEVSTKVTVKDRSKDAGRPSRRREDT